MLTALLTTIQSSLGQLRPFVFGSLLPSVLFLAANMALLIDARPSVMAWANKIETDQKGFTMAAITLGILGFTYLLSALTTVLREVLEGRHLPDFLTSSLLAGQVARLDRIDAHLKELLRGKSDLERAIGDADEGVPGWQMTLREARLKGAAKPGCAPLPLAIREDLERLRGMRLRGCFLDTLSFLRLPVLLADFLATNNADNHGDSCSSELSSAHEELLKLFDYARGKAHHEFLRTYNRRQFTYPGALSPENAGEVNVLAPTLMGNIARTARSYALTRYGLDLEIFWTRLQRSAQTDTAFFGTLQDCKTQLDFLIAACWLTGLLTVIWTIAFARFDLWGPFTAVVALGPVATYGWYRVACQVNRAFSDLLRSSVDLFRFKLLGDLHLGLPYGIFEERVLWDQMNGLTGYGRDVPVTYKHP